MIAASEAYGAVVDDVALLRHRQLMATLSIIEKLKLIRKRRKWTAAQAGKEWGIKASTLRAYESERRKNPSERRTDNAIRIEVVIRKEEAFGGVLHHLWRPNQPTNDHRRPVTKTKTQKSNDYKRTKPRRGAGGAPPRPKRRP